MRLPTKPESGYEWRLYEPLSAAIKPEGAPAAAQERRELWTFTPVRNGEQTLRFEYRKPRDYEAPPAASVAYAVTVREKATSVAALLEPVAQHVRAVAGASLPKPIQPRSPSTASSRRSRTSRVLPSISRKVPLRRLVGEDEVAVARQTRAWTREANGLDDHDVVGVVAPHLQRRPRAADGEDVAAVDEFQHARPAAMPIRAARSFR